MKQIKIIYSVALSLLSLVGTLDAKSSIPSSDFTWSNREIIGAVCIGGLCVMGVGAIFYINRLEKRIEEQDRRFEAQDLINKQHNGLLNVHQSDIHSGKESRSSQADSICILNELYKGHVTKIAELERKVQATNDAQQIYNQRIAIVVKKLNEERKQQENVFHNRITSLEQWKEENTFYSFASPCGSDSE